MAPAEKRGERFTRHYRVPHAKRHFTTNIYIFKHRPNWKKEKSLPLVPLKVSGLCMNFFIAVSQISELYSYGKALELKEELPELLNPRQERANPL